VTSVSHAHTNVETCLPQTPSIEQLVTLGGWVAPHEQSWRPPGTGCLRVLGKQNDVTCGLLSVPMSYLSFLQACVHALLSPWGALPWLLGSFLRLLFPGGHPDPMLGQAPLCLSGFTWG
jgi:hypothetical protein